jgi:hypothetical protein
MDKIDGQGSLVELGIVRRIDSSGPFIWGIDSPYQSEKCQKFHKCWTSLR